MIDYIYGLSVGVIAGLNLGFWWELFTKFDEIPFPWRRLW